MKWRVNKKAFTLIEVLAAMVLFALMTLGISSTIQMTSRLTKQVKSRKASSLSASIAMDRMQRELQEAYNENTPKTLSLFQARDESGSFTLRFSFLESEIRTLVDRRASGSIIATYTLEKAGDGTSNLLRSELPMVDLPGPSPVPVPQVLAKGVVDWKMEFFDVKTYQWSPNWDSLSEIHNGVFPYAIRLTLETVDPSLKDEIRKEKSLRLSTEFLVLNELERP